MQITVDSHQIGLFGQRRLQRDVARIAEQAATLVQARCGRLPQVRLTLTHERGLAQLAAADDAAFAPGASLLSKVRQARGHRRGARGAFAITVLNPAGGIHIIVNVAQAEAAGELAVTVLHELVHAVQLSAPGARELHIRDIHHAYGVSRWSRREERDYNALVDRREAEARGLEHLAAQLT